MKSTTVHLIVISATGTVGNWFREFRIRRQSLEDESCAGRSHTAVTDENVASVLKLVIEDPHISYREIETTIEIGSTGINTILDEYLQVKKLCARWVPQGLTQEKKAARVDWCHTMLKKFKNGKAKDVYNIVTDDGTWLYYYEPETKRQSTVCRFPDDEPRTKVRKSRSGRIKIIVSFFSITGNLTTVPLENQRTVTAEWHTTHCLPKVISTWQSQNPKSKKGHFLLQSVFAERGRKRPPP